MFVSRKLQYVALPKTASTHITRLLGHLVDGVERAQHSLVRPEDFIDGRRFVGSIRSPWRYYVSLWAFGCKGLGGVRTRFLRDPANEDLYADAGDPSRFRKWLRLVLNNHAAIYPSHIDVYRGPFTRFAGLLTARYCYWFLNPQCHRALRDVADFPALHRFIGQNCFIDDFIRLEHLNTDFSHALRNCGIEISPKQSALIRAAPPTNPSSPLLASDAYYDSELIDLVAMRDSAIVDRFSYDRPEPKMSVERLP